MDSQRDSRWSSAVAEKANHKCIHCGSTMAGAHHIIPRGCLKTRYILENGLYCCDKLHRGLEGKKSMKKPKRELERIYIGIQKKERLEKIKLGLATPQQFGFTVVN